MLLAIIPQGSAGGGLDTVNSINDALYRLGFTGAADLAAVSWLTQSELYQFADDAAKKLAWQHGLFIAWDTSITVNAGTAAYSLPSSHVFTLLAALVPASGPIQFLRLTSVRDLWALDANWTTSSGDAVRASLDAGSVGTITLYPNPLSGGTLSEVCQEYPSTLQPGSSQITLPTVLQDYFTYAMLAGARGKESEQAMREMADHYRKRLDLYDQVIGHLWGAGQ